MTRSLAITIPAAMGYDANRMLAACDMGPRNFSVLCYGSELLIGLHAWEGDATRYTAPAEPDGGWGAHGLTTARAAEITGAMQVSDQPIGEAPADEFAALAGSQGATWGALLPQLEEVAPAGSGVTVRKGEFYQTTQPGFDVVEVVQDLPRHDPNHNDLNALRAHFEVKRDPFNPAEWVPPVGSSGLYKLTNLIGGPELAIFNDLLWVNDLDNNHYPPDVYGWKRYNVHA